MEHSLKLLVLALLLVVSICISKVWLERLLKPSDPVSILVRRRCWDMFWCLALKLLGAYERTLGSFVAYGSAA